jgi:hypothetical protein
LVEEAQSIAAGMGFKRHTGWVLDFGTERGHGAVRTIVVGLLDLERDPSPKEAEAAISLRSLPATTPSICATSPKSRSARTTARFARPSTAGRAPAPRSASPSI